VRLGVKPAPFRYVRAGGTADAAALLAMHGTEARLLAGGQSLMPLLARRIERPRIIIDINRIAGLDRIELDSTHVRVGALVRQEQALRSGIVREYAAGVAEALAWVANPVVRQRGTVIGNLVTNAPGAELPAVAIALCAEFVLQFPDRTETIPVAQVLGADRGLPHDAMVTHVLWPRRSGRAACCEVTRREGHAPVVSVTVSEAQGDWRVAVSGVCATGLSCPSMAQILARDFPAAPDTADLARALEADVRGPLFGDVHSSARYRLEVAPIIGRRAAQRLCPGAIA
jgi:aerobic carbon-monoxide dehydrogenase medium subunit